MRIMVDIENASVLTPTVWSASLDPTHVQKLSAPLSTAGGTTVLLVEDAQFDSEAGRLTFPFGRVRVLNLGSTDTTLLIAASSDSTQSETDGSAYLAVEPVKRAEPSLGFGDRDCIRAFKQMPAEMQEAAQRLIDHIRFLDPTGDFKREGQRYVNRPDNFVTLQPQPRVREILVTFKGAVKTNLKIASARRPYQGFKVRRGEDVPEALRVLQSAKRRS